MKSLKVHYHGLRDARAYCGATTTADKLTRKVADVTCKLCLRHLAGELRKPIEERREGKKVSKPTKVHWCRIADEAPACGERSPDARRTHEQDKITCGRCLRLLGIEVGTLEENVAGSFRRMLAFNASTNPLDSLMRTAFKDYETGLRARLEALKLAIAASHETPSALLDMREEAQALVDYLEGN